MKRFARTAAVAATMLFGTAIAAAGVWDLPWYTVDGGGGTASGGGFELSGTAGQPEVGAAMTGADFELTGGFWVGGGVEALPCPADVDGSGDVGFDDLLGVLGAWGDCPGCPQDINGDDVVAFDDLLAVLGAWGPCP